MLVSSTLSLFLKYKPSFRATRSSSGLQCVCRRHYNVGKTNGMREQTQSARGRIKQKKKEPRKLRCASKHMTRKDRKNK